MSENEEKNEGMFKKGVKLPKIVKTIFLIFIIVLLIGSGLIIGVNYKSQTKVTKFGLKDMGELVTQAAYVTIVQDSKEDRDFFNLFTIPFTESHIIFSLDFTVYAGVNFEKISYVEDEENKEFKVDLPHAKPFETVPNFKSKKIYLDQDSLFSRIDLTEQKEAEIKMVDEATKTAIENNLLGAADQNAQRIISAMLKSDQNKKDYTVVYNYID